MIVSEIKIGRLQPEKSRNIPIPIPKNFIEEKITINRLGCTSNGTEKTRYITQ